MTLTGASQVYQGQEGTGAAFILPGSNQTPFDVLQGEVQGLRYRQQVEEQNRLKAEKDRQDQLVKSLGDLKLSMEGVLPADATRLGEGQMRIRDKYAEGLGMSPSGVFNGISNPQEYGAWEKEKIQWENEVNTSVQANKLINDSIAELTRNRDKYDPDKSIAKIRAFHDLPPSEKMKQGVKPLLVPKPIDLNKINSVFVDELRKSRNTTTENQIGGQYIKTTKITQNDPEQVKQYSANAFQRVVDEGGVEQLQTLFISLPESQQDAYEDEAKRQGRDPMEFFNYKKFIEPGLMVTMDEDFKNANTKEQKEDLAQNEAQYYMDQMGNFFANPASADKSFLVGHVWNKEQGSFGEKTIRITGWGRDAQGKLTVSLDNGKTEVVDPNSPSFMNRIYKHNYPSAGVTLSDKTHKEMLRLGAVRSDGSYDWKKYNQAKGNQVDGTPKFSSVKKTETTQPGIKFSTIKK